MRDGAWKKVAALSAAFLAWAGLGRAWGQEYQPVEMPPALPVSYYEQQAQEMDALRAKLDQYDSQFNARLTALETAKADEKKAADGEASVKKSTVGSDMGLTAKWNNGLNFESPNKDFTWYVGGQMQEDFVWFDADPTLPGPGAVELPGFSGNLPAEPFRFEDGVFFRRARLQFTGKIWEVFDYSLQFDVVGTDTTFQDNFIQISEIPYIGHLKLGHQKEPMGLESYGSNKYLTFMERTALSECFLQEYDPGVAIWDNYMDDRGMWGTGFFRVDPEDDGADFGGGDYAWTSRITFLPIDQPDDRHLIHTGASYSHRNTEFLSPAGPDTVRFRTRPELRGTPRLIDTGNIAADNVDLVGLEAAYVSGPFSVQGEYLNVWVDDASFNGWYVFASYFLTGENRAYDRRTGTFGRIKPFSNVFYVETEDGCCKGCGAWEVAARYSSCDLNDGAVEGGILDETTLGLNWYWNPNMKVQWNYLFADRHDRGGAFLDGEVHGLGMRFSLDF